MDKSINMTRIVFLAIVAAIGGILFGYDTAVISGTTEIVKNQFRLTTIAEGWYVGCALIGSILGVMTAGMMSDHLGRKKTMLISALMFSVSAIGCAVCDNFNQLVVFRIIGGFGIGIVSIVSPIYISEIAPAQKRGSLVSLYQLAITIGFLMAYLIKLLCPEGRRRDLHLDGSLDKNIQFRVLEGNAWLRDCSGSSVPPRHIPYPRESALVDHQAQGR